VPRNTLAFGENPIANLGKREDGDAMKGPARGGMGTRENESRRQVSQGCA